MHSMRALMMFLLAQCPSVPNLASQLEHPANLPDAPVASYRSNARLRHVRMAQGFSVRLRVTDKVNQLVSPANRTLDAYMKLPVAAYALMPMPPNSALQRISGTADEFILDMPPLTFAPLGFLSVEVQPRCYARVVPTPDAVHITAQRCILRGSNIVKQLGLNERFRFGLDTKFTWDQRSITSSTSVRVDVKPPPPFALTPTGLMEQVGNSVMRYALGLIQTEFLKVLGRDFERWSSDDAYFDARAKLLEE